MVDPDHQDHPDLRAHLEVVEVLEVAVDNVEYLVEAVMVLVTQEHLSVTPIILSDLFNVIVVEELFVNNVMVSHTIPLFVTVNKYASKTASLRILSNPFL